MVKNRSPEEGDKNNSEYLLNSYYVPDATFDLQYLVQLSEYYSHLKVEEIWLRENQYH